MKTDHLASGGAQQGAILLGRRGRRDAQHDVLGERPDRPALGLAGASRVRAAGDGPDPVPHDPPEHDHPAVPDERYRLPEPAEVLARWRARAHRDGLGVRLRYLSAATAVEGGAPPCTQSSARVAASASAATSPAGRAQASGFGAS